MPGQIPRKPDGSSAAAIHQRWLHDANVNEAKLVHVTGQRTENTTAGKVVYTGRRGRGSSVSVTQFKLRFVEDDYLVCREWDGTTLGTEDVYIAKPYKLRCSLASEEVYGLTHAYTYEPDPEEPYIAFEDGGEWDGEVEADFDSGGVMFELRMNQVRTVDDGTDSETQRVVPPWLRGDVIYAIEFDGGDTAVGFVTDAGQPIEYIMISESRIWARV